MAFDNDMPHSIKKGQNFTVKIKFGGTTSALMIKRGAFYQVTGGNWIYLLDKDRTIARKQPIRIGRQNTDNYEILEGLKEGDEVIISSYKPYNEKEKLILQ